MTGRPPDFEQRLAALYASAGLPSDEEVRGLQLGLRATLGSMTYQRQRRRSSDSAGVAVFRTEAAEVDHEGCILRVRRPPAPGRRSA
ncbi:hypothetical protein ACFXAF_00120 [Kitasatospora sp. NPDC059463]|uniref:hypothetical protein n=1 Tax=unclassified Kitasatospora TaxID=2633591 RepID=UPI003680E163